MLDKIPDAEEMTALVGQPFFEVWTKLCATIDEKYDMECLWNNGGKSGLMNTNIAEAEKLYARCMQEKAVWVL